MLKRQKGLTIKLNKDGKIGSIRIDDSLSVSVEEFSTSTHSVAPRSID
jgi:hypothetical protein